MRCSTNGKLNFAINILWTSLLGEMPHKHKQRQVKAVQPGFVVECRKNMGQSAAYKRVSMGLQKVGEFKPSGLPRNGLRRTGKGAMCTS